MTAATNSVSGFVKYERASSIRQYGYREAGHCGRSACRMATNSIPSQLLKKVEEKGEKERKMREKREKNGRKRGEGWQEFDKQK